MEEKIKKALHIHVSGATSNDERPNSLAVTGSGNSGSDLVATDSTCSDQDGGKDFVQLFNRTERTLDSLTEKLLRGAQYSAHHDVMYKGLVASALTLGILTFMMLWVILAPFLGHHSLHYNWHYFDAQLIFLVSALAVINRFCGPALCYLADWCKRKNAFRLAELFLYLPASRSHFKYPFSYRVQTKLFDFYCETGQLEKADRLIDTTIASLQNMEQLQNPHQWAMVGERSSARAAILARLGDVSVAQATATYAIDIFAKALSSKYGKPDESLKIQFDTSLGLYFEHMGQYKQSLEHYRSALTSMLGEASEIDSLLALINDIGSAYFKLGALEQAQKWLELGINCVERSHGSNAIGQKTKIDLLTNYASIQINLGNLDRAANLLASAKKISMRFPNSLDTANVLSNLGLLHARKEEFHEAESYFKEALRIRDRQMHSECRAVIENRKQYLDVLRHLGKFNTAQNIELELRPLSLGQSNCSDVIPPSQKNPHAVKQKRRISVVHGFLTTVFALFVLVLWCMFGRGIVRFNLIARCVSPAYEYYSEGVRLSSDFWYRKSADNLQSARNALEKACTLDKDGTIGKLAYGYAQSELPVSIPNDEVLNLLWKGAR